MTILSNETDNLKHHTVTLTTISAKLQQRQSQAMKLTITSVTQQLLQSSLLRKRIRRMLSVTQQQRQSPSKETDHPMHYTVTPTIIYATLQQR